MKKLKLGQKIVLKNPENIKWDEKDDKEEIYTAYQLGVIYKVTGIYKEKIELDYNFTKVPYKAIIPIDETTKACKTKTAGVKVSPLKSVEGQGIPLRIRINKDLQEKILKLVAVTTGVKDEYKYGNEFKRYLIRTPYLNALNSHIKILCSKELLDKRQTTITLKRASLYDEFRHSIIECIRTISSIEDMKSFELYFLEE